MPLTESPIRMVEFNGDKWYHLGDISRYMFLDYDLKWPQDIIEIVEVRHEVNRHDPVEYVLEKEFFDNLTWRYEYRNDEKITDLYQLLIGSKK